MGKLKEIEKQALLIKDNEKQLEFLKEKIEESYDEIAPDEWDQSGKETDELIADSKRIIEELRRDKEIK